jgi:hypothetical protein
MDNLKNWRPATASRPTRQESQFNRQRSVFARFAVAAGVVFAAL